MDLPANHCDIPLSHEERSIEAPDQGALSLPKRDQIVLYVRKTCPYCKKVANYLESIGKSIPTRDIGLDPKAHRELSQAGRREKIQVPCLFINGKPHYESDWIINWLQESQSQY